MELLPSYLKRHGRKSLEEIILFFKESFFGSIWASQKHAPEKVLIGNEVLIVCITGAKNIKPPVC